MLVLTRNDDSKDLPLLVMLSWGLERSTEQGDRHFRKEMALTFIFAILIGDRSWIGFVNICVLPTWESILGVQEDLA
jgi:hypothetical protein